MPPEAYSRSTKAIVFDLMGTCTNWHPNIVRALRAAPSLPQLPESDIPQLATDWRARFFKEIADKRAAGEPAEDIDVTHGHTLNYLLMERGIDYKHWSKEVRAPLIQAWHHQDAWPDTGPALQRLRKKFDVIVLSHGSTRLQIDVTKGAGLEFDAVISNEMTGKSKPDPAAYQKALKLLKVDPQEALMVAAHVYDLRGAREAGLRTAYVQRTTEDPREDMAKVRQSVDFFFDGTKGGEDCGIAEVATVLGA